MGLVHMLPLDHHIFLHKMTGMVIFCQAWFHTIMHLCNYCECITFAVLVKVQQALTFSAINIVPTPDKFLALNLENFGVTTIEETGYNQPEGCTETQVF